LIRAEIIRRKAAGDIVGYRVEGHALFADEGNDIVCAGVSAVAVGAVNAAEAVAGVKLLVRMEKGLLHAAVPDQVPDAAREKLETVLEAMTVMLRTIEKSYGSYIRIKEIYK